MSGTGSCGMDAEECSSSSGSEAGAEAEAEAPLFTAMMHEARHNLPDQCLSRELRRDLEGMSGEARVALVSRRDRGGNAPLFVASAAGNVPLVEYLVDVCDAPLEQRGVYRAAHERVAHRVTPLWAAAVAGHLGALRALRERGARLDAPSDSGSTPLRSACFLSRVEVARYLVACGADVTRANHHGGTCLVNAVQCAPLCRLLLAAGAPVDARDLQHKTALHHAIQEHREETARLLLAAGADPALRTRRGDDALQLAAIKGAARLVHALAERAAVARAADALELLGATQLDVYNDAQAALASWRRATALRLAHRPRPLHKRPVRARPPPWASVREWSAPEELAARAERGGWLRAQALLVALRVLGPRHHELHFRLMYRGAAEADAGRDARAAALWTWVLEQRIQQHTLLHSDTMQTLVALTRLLEESADGALHAPSAATAVLRQLVAACPESARLVAQRPACRAQCALWDRVLRCAVHLVATATAPWPERALLDPHPTALYRDCRDQVRALVRLQLASASTGDSLLHLACSRLNVVHSTYFPERTTQVRMRLQLASASTGDSLLHLACSRLNVVHSTYFPERTTQVRMRLQLASASTGDSLLHLACSRLNVVHSTYFPERTTQGEFPSVRVARVLLGGGADVARRNHAGSTPLHVAAIPYNYSTEMVELLLCWGAHLDQPNRFGDRPSELLQQNRRSRICPLRHLSLACLAARALLASPPPPPRRLPASLARFLALHAP